MSQKSFLTQLGELIDARRAEQQARNPQGSSLWGRAGRWLMPNGGTLLIAAILIFTQSVWARPNNTVNVPGPSATTINYQGRLANSGGTPLTGTYGMQFAIFDAPTGGNLVWGPESHAAVPVSNGLFNVGLGSQTSGGVLTTVWNGDRYLEITVGGETLAPRELIRSVPLAGMALTVPDGAIGTAQLANGSVVSSTIANGSVTKAKLSSAINLLRLESGITGANTTTPGWGLHVGSGTRTYTLQVNFTTPYVQAPKVNVALATIDASSTVGQRITVNATNITLTGFQINIITWADSIVYGVSVSWLAYGSE